MAKLIEEETETTADEKDNYTDSASNVSSDVELDYDEKQIHPRLRT